MSTQTLITQHIRNCLANTRVPKRSKTACSNAIYKRVSTDPTVENLIQTWTKDVPEELIDSSIDWPVLQPYLDRYIATVNV